MIPNNELETTAGGCLFKGPSAINIGAVMVSVLFQYLAGGKS